MLAMRVLVVEDDDALAALVARKLEAAGHQVRQCASGEQAIELLDQETLDAVWSDGTLAGALTGVYVLRAAAQAQPAARLFLVTGSLAIAALPPQARALDKKDLPGALRTVLAALAE